MYQGPTVTIDGVDRATLLVGDLDGVGQGSECAPVPIINDRPDQEAWLRVRDDPNCFSFLKMFPGGFTPGSAPSRRTSPWCLASGDGRQL